MKSMPITPTLLLAAVLALVPAAAGAQDVANAPATTPLANATPDVTVTDLTLGMYVTQDKRIAVPMTTFRPEDTISLCITTLVAPGSVHSGTLGVWWTHGEGETLRSLKSDVAEMLFNGEGRVVFTIEIRAPGQSGYITSKYSSTASASAGRTSRSSDAH